MSDSEKPVASTASGSPGYVSATPLRNHKWLFRMRYRIALIYCLFFNFPGFYNLLQGLKIAKTTQGKVLGFTKAYCFFPLIPWGIIIWCLWFFGIVEGPTCGLLWFLIAIICAGLTAEDLIGKALLAAVGIAIGLTGVGVALRYGAGWDLLGWIAKGLEFCGFLFVPAYAMVGAAIMLIWMKFSFARSLIEMGIRFDGDFMYPVLLGQTSSYSFKDHRLTSTVGDWNERAVFGAKDWHIVSILSKEKAKDQAEDAIHSVLNVPCGVLIEKIVYKNMVQQS